MHVSLPHRFSSTPRGKYTGGRRVKYTINYNLLRNLFHSIPAPKIDVQRLAKVDAPGLMRSTAVAYHFCPSLPAAFTQPGALTLANLCTYNMVPIPYSYTWSSALSIENQESHHISHETCSIRLCACERRGRRVLRPGYVARSPFRSHYKFIRL